MYVNDQCVYFVLLGPIYPLFVSKNAPDDVKKKKFVLSGILLTTPGLFSKLPDFFIPAPRQSDGKVSKIKSALWVFKFLQKRIVIERTVLTLL